jgi:hypothetical protein
MERLSDKEFMVKIFDGYKDGKREFFPRYMYIDATNANLTPAMRDKWMVNQEIIMNKLISESNGFSDIPQGDVSIDKWFNQSEHSDAEKEAFEKWNIVKDNFTKRLTSLQCSCMEVDRYMYHLLKYRSSMTKGEVFALDTGIRTTEFREKGNNTPEGVYLVCDGLLDEKSKTWLKKCEKRFLEVSNKELAGTPEDEKTASLYDAVWKVMDSATNKGIYLDIMPESSVVWLEMHSMGVEYSSEKPQVNTKMVSAENTVKPEPKRELEKPAPKKKVTKSKSK